MPSMPFATDCLRNLSESVAVGCALVVVFCIMGGGNDILRGLSWLSLCLIRPGLRFSFLADWQVKSWH